MLNNYIAFLKAHQFLMVLLVVGYLVLKLGSGVEQLLVQHDTARSTAADTVLAAQVQATAQLAASVASLQKQVADTASRTQHVVTQIAQVPVAVKQLPTAQLEPDLETKLGVAPGSLMTPPVLQQVDTIVTEYPLMKQEIIDLDNQIAALNAVNAKQHEQIIGLDAQIKDANNACKASTELAVAKANSHRTLWLRIVGGAAFVAGAFIGHGI